jgi:hypothetical protein
MDRGYDRRLPSWETGSIGIRVQEARGNDKNEGSNFWVCKLSGPSIGKARKYGKGV